MFHRKIEFCTKDHTHGIIAQHIGFLLGYIWQGVGTQAMNKTCKKYLYFDPIVKEISHSDREIEPTYPCIIATDIDNLLSILQQHDATIQIGRYNVVIGNDVVRIGELDLSVAEVHDLIKAVERRWGIV